MFEKTLSDLVRGIRAHKSNEHQYISQCMTEIKKELKQENLSVKANAVSKLTYLQMLGYDISWAAFNIIEVMSSTKFTYKRIGYLAATQCFHDDLDVVMLTTNMIRKDISSHNQYDSSMALNGLACFMTPDLARDLANDVLTLMSSSKPYLRKKGVLTMYKVFTKFPDALRPAFPRLKERLEDPDPGVQSAAVSVICELARKNPRNYLSLAPIFFKMMTNSSNNWMLIKIIKLFGALTPLEPRLGKKLVEPLTNLIHSTTAMSLLYECVSTVIVGIPNHTASIQLCISKLRLFIEDADQNLKYLGLLAMAKILEHHPKIIQQHKDVVVECLDDRDDSIRLRALDLIAGMVSKKNLVEITKKLVSHMEDSESTGYRDEVLSKIILICSQNNYQHITNFEWYITVLVEMTKFEGTQHGKLIAAQMLDVSIRVKDVRPFAVRQMSTILENTHLFTGTTRNNGICEVLYAAAWIVGEFSEHLTNPRSTLDSLLNPKVVALPPHIQAVFVQNIVKLYASILVKAEAEGTSEALEEVGGMLVEKLPVFIQSGDLEVQERACCILQLMKYIVKLQSKGAAIGDELMALFEGDLNPVAPKAQKKVPVPEGLDLDKWIYEPPSESEEESKDDNLSFMLPYGSSGGGAFGGGASYSPTESPKGKKKKKRSKRDLEEEEEMKRRREERLQSQMSNPHYLKPSASPKMAPATRSSGPVGLTESSGLTAGIDTSRIPVQKLELGIGLIIEEPKATPTQKKKKKKKRGKKGRRGDDSSEEEHVPRPIVDTSMGEMPEGAMESDGEGKGKARKMDDLSMALDQNLDMPLRDDEVLPVRQHRVVLTADVPGEEVEQEPKKKEKRKKKKKGDEEEAVEEEGKADGKRKKKKRSSKRAAEEAGEEPSLIDIGEGEEPSAAAVATKAASPKRKSPARDTKKQGEVDDLEFWLSTDTTPAKGGTEQQPSAAVASEDVPKSSKKRSKKKGGAKAEPTPEATPTVSTVVDEPEVGVEADEVREEEEEGEGKRRKKKGEKGKRDKKGSKKSKKGAAVAEVADTVPAESAASGGGDLFGLDVSPQQDQPSETKFQVLAEDANLKMTYEVRSNPLFSQQVTVAVIFQNQTPHQLVSIDFNVMDSLNTKLDRPMGTSTHEGIKVPFQLPPGHANECQFTFYVQSFLMPQKLRGTVTYMVKSEEGTTGEKIDFKVHLPCSAFICPVPCAQQQFATLLSGGTLTVKQTIKVPLSKMPDFGSALSSIASGLRLVIVERVEESASLYGSSIANHHICLLVKSLGNNTLSVSAKGTDSQLISNLLDELKTLV